MNGVLQKHVIEGDNEGTESDACGATPSFVSKLLSTEEVCQRLNISSATLYSRINEGRFHPVKQGVRNYFHIDEIVAEEKRCEEIWRGKVRPGGGMRGAARLPKPEKKDPVPYFRIPQPKLPEYTGDAAADAFGLFDEGKSQRDAVKTLKLTCEQVEHLYEKWKAFGPEWHLSPQALAQARKRLDWWEEPPTAKGFMNALNITIQREAERIVEEQAAGAASPAASDSESEADEPSRAAPLAKVTASPSVPEPVTSAISALLGKSAPTSASAPLPSTPSEPMEPKKPRQISLDDVMSPEEIRRLEDSASQD